jgi:hypothetical protein
MLGCVGDILERRQLALCAGESDVQFWSSVLVAAPRLSNRHQSIA